MPPPSRPMLSEPPREADVAIVGAGSAGIAAARRCLAAGLTVAVVEARDRIGGRAVTVLLKAHPVDLGAHWLHSGPINPMVRLGALRGEPLRRAPVGRPLSVARPPPLPAPRRALERALPGAPRALAPGAGGPRGRAAG